MIKFVLIMDEIVVKSLFSDDPFLAEDSFIPYHVIYRFKGNSELRCNTFMTLFELFDFLRSNLDNIKSYRVGRCLETYNV